MRHIVLGTALILAGFASAQSAFKLYFTPKVGGVHFALGDVVSSASGEKMEIDYFNYYISNLHLMHDGGQDLDLSDSVYLVKHDNFVLDLGQLNIVNLESVKFGVGVPQELNHLDISQYPIGHPLSYQTPSMQWGWSAGYIHMIVGGNADSDQNDIPDAYFEIHSLGDGNYYLLDIACGATNENDGSKSIYLDCNLDTWLGMTDLATNGIKHGETGVNYTVMKNVILRPVFTASSNASQNELLSEDAQLIFYANQGANTLKWVNINKPELLNLTDINGRLVKTFAIKEHVSEMNIGEFKSGVYFVSLFDKANKLLLKKQIVF